MKNTEQTLYSILGMKEKPEALISDLKNYRNISKAFAEECERALKKAQEEGKPEVELEEIRSTILLHRKKVEAVELVLESNRSDMREEFNKSAIILFYIKSREEYEENKKKILKSYEKKISKTESILHRISLQNMRKKELEALASDFEKKKDAYEKLSDDNYRKQYNKELSDFRNREQIKENAELRIQYSKKLVRLVLGEEFNPDMSGLNTDSQIESLDYDQYKWQVKIDEKRKRILSAEVVDEENILMNQNIEVYRYGEIKSSWLYNPRKNAYTINDSPCSIIGVTKTNSDGTVDTNFLIMPSRRIDKSGEDFFARIYLSDYMIHNAINNNAYYLGTLDVDSSGQRTIKYNNPGDLDRIKSYFYAQRNPGLMQITSSEPYKTKYATPENIGEVFEELNSRIKHGFYDEREIPDR